MTKVLVTGGAGFIGSHLVDRLLQEGFEVRVLDLLDSRVHPAGKPAWVSKEAEFIQGDVRDAQTMLKALQGVSIVFHEAAYQDYMPDFSRFLHVNSVSTALIHELILEHKLGVEKVIVASSQAVYGEGQYRCKNSNCQNYHQVIQPPAREEKQLQKGHWEVICPLCQTDMEPLRLKEEYANPYNAYAISKYAEELSAVRLGKLHHIPSVALRYSIVQGPRQSLFNQYSGICRIFSVRLMNGLPPIIYEDGLQTRDFTHVADVVEANITVLKDARADYQVFNVGSGHAITVLEYARVLTQQFGLSIEPLLQGEYRLGDNRHSVSDISRLQALGWQPTRTLHHIFDDYLQWIANQGNVLDYFKVAETSMKKAGVVRKVSSFHE
ncbi:SDR family NAD(P)-dependent oxidoreductase [Anaerolinea thermophila]|uniref:NAD-dependent epimerase/dehydratase family protein n=1 Tax=Anaerolinea thermophila (strain DSM 14523 / JCM 11388 / NBRC 100420 / UNI-1) TaxID=926569 RepID=E8MXH0_ANATU|nr:SDR family NAD(P)-dependent oxidoreductase [Anaerolinea thermophila]BAJ64051.1 NAD-dependent epimerase/dehydratase family protein [Anaerolinea thermophila UNI-1]